MNEEQSKELLEIQREQLKMQQEQRKFTILQRERAMSEESRKKTTSSILAATCILGAGVAMHFSGMNPNDVIQHELSAIYSWESLGQYIQDLGPMVTLLSAGAGGFIAKAFKHHRKYKDAQHQFEDMNASLQNREGLEMEEQNNAKAR